MLVDDGSTDGTRELIQTRLRERVDRVILHEANRGKGAALRSGFAAATGDVVVVQDADLEYDPAEYPKLLRPFLEQGADVVFGSRFIGGESHRVLYYWHYVGNRLLTTISNVFTNLNLTDMEVCYKLFRRELLERITHRGGSLRLRAGDHGEAREARLLDLRGRHLLRRAHLRRGQEDRLARRTLGLLVHPQVQPAALARRRALSPAPSLCAAAALPRVARLRHRSVARRGLELALRRDGWPDRSASSRSSTTRTTTT